MPIERLRSHALFLALAFAALPTLHAQIDRIASFSAGAPNLSDWNPDLAVQPGGSFLLTWQQNGPGLTFKAHAQRFDAAGRPLATAVELWEGFGPQVGSLPDGGFVATSGFQVGSTAPGIRLHRLDALGRPSGDPIVVTIHLGAPFFDFSSHLAVAPNGSVAVVWLDPDQLLRGRFFDASLRPVSDAIFLSNLSSSLQPEFDPDLSFQADGTALVVWSRLNEQGALQIFGRRFSATGQPLSEAFPISQPPPLQLDTNPRVIALADGGWWAGWLRHPPLPPFPEVPVSDPWVARLGADGTPVQAERSLGVPDASGGFAVGTDPAGNLLVLGIHTASVSGRIFGRDGTTASTLFTLPGAFSSLQPAVADRSPGFLAAWSNYASPVSTADLQGTILSPACQDGKSTACLGPDGRYAVEVAWQNGAQSGTAKPLPLAGNVATFGLRNAADHDVTVLLSGPGSRDLTFSATTGAALEIRVTDKTSGVVRTFSKPAGRFASRRIPNALPNASRDAGIAVAALAADPSAEDAPRAELDETCVPTSRALCLLGGRFRAELFGGQSTRPALALLRTDRSGAFAFPSAPETPLVTLTMIDGRAGNGKFWVYLGGLSRAGYGVKITDLSTGVAKTYTNPTGRLDSRADRRAF